MSAHDEKDRRFPEVDLIWLEHDHAEPPPPFPKISSGESEKASKVELPCRKNRAEQSPQSSMTRTSNPTTGPPGADTRPSKPSSIFFFASLPMVHYEESYFKAVFRWLCQEPKNAQRLAYRIAGKDVDVKGVRRCLKDYFADWQNSWQTRRPARQDLGHILDQGARNTPRTDNPSIFATRHFWRWFYITKTPLAQTDQKWILRMLARWITLTPEGTFCYNQTTRGLARGGLEVFLKVVRYRVVRDYRREKKPSVALCNTKVYFRVWNPFDLKLDKRCFSNDESDLLANILSGDSKTLPRESHDNRPQSQKLSDSPTPRQNRKLPEDCSAPIPKPEEVPASINLPSTSSDASRLENLPKITPITTQKNQSGVIDVVDSHDGMSGPGCGNNHSPTGKKPPPGPSPSRKKSSASAGKSAAHKRVRSSSHCTVDPLEFRTDYVRDVYQKKLAALRYSKSDTRPRAYRHSSKSPAKRVVKNTSNQCDPINRLKEVWRATAEASAESLAAHAPQTQKEVSVEERSSKNTNTCLREKEAQQRTEALLLGHESSWYSSDKDTKYCDNVELSASGDFGSPRSRSSRMSILSSAFQSVFGDDKIIGTDTDMQFSSTEGACPVQCRPPSGESTRAARATSPPKDIVLLDHKGRVPPYSMTVYGMPVEESTRSPSSSEGPAPPSCFCNSRTPADFAQVKGAIKASSRSHEWKTFLIPIEKAIADGLHVKIVDQFCPAHQAPRAIRVSAELATRPVPTQAQPPLLTMKIVEID